MNAAFTTDEYLFSPIGGALTIGGAKIGPPNEFSVLAAKPLVVSTNFTNKLTFIFNFLHIDVNFESKNAKLRARGQIVRN